jgi:hypothetical protein
MNTRHIGIVNGFDTWEVLNEDGVVVGMNQSIPAAVPDSITAVQIRLWMLNHNITADQVDAAIAALPDETREATRIEWEYSGTIHRASSTLVAMATAFGLDSAAVDAAFAEAAGL